jgi:hypothetical protein
VKEYSAFEGSQFAFGVVLLTVNNAPVMDLAVGEQ